MTKAFQTPARHELPFSHSAQEKKMPTTSEPAKTDPTPEECDATERAITKRMLNGEFDDDAPRAEHEPLPPPERKGE